MGRLTYDSSLIVEFDDRTLAHLQLVIGAKIRRGESFYFCWRDEPHAGGGRTAIWLYATVPMEFRYYGGRSPSINRHWIDVLMLSANSPQGLQLTPEPNEATVPSEMASV
ncbi:ATP-dependent DNA ligase [Herbiconiux sp. P15]|uniref:DUF7882 family protein n=1 Tax=Herbiconiux liukaitaii TaxID=3342799 RepID=UPI0035B89620